MADIKQTIKRAAMWTATSILLLQGVSAFMGCSNQDAEFKKLSKGEQELVIKLRQDHITSPDTINVEIGALVDSQSNIEEANDIISIIDREVSQWDKNLARPHIDMGVAEITSFEMFQGVTVTHEFRAGHVIYKLQEKVNQIKYLDKKELVDLITKLEEKIKELQTKRALFTQVIKEIRERMESKK